MKKIICLLIFILLSFNIMNSRKEIRDNFVSEITSELSTAGVGGIQIPVKNYRVSRLDKETLPLVNIYTPMENNSKFGEAPDLVERNLTIKIEIINTGNIESEVVDWLDEKVNLIEKVCYNSLLIRQNPECKEINLSGTETEVFTEAGKIYGSQILTFNYKYVTNETILDPLTPDLNNITSTYQLDGSPEEIINSETIPT